MAAVACVLLATTPSAGSPRNGAIAYSFVEQEEGAGRSWIELVSPRGTHRRRVTCTTGAFDTCRDGLPVFSRDGKRLAIVNSSEIVIARASGDVLRRIPVAAATVAWSPNGRRIAYTKGYMDARRVVHHSVFVTRLGGSARELAPARDVDPFGLSWSSRGLLAWERVSGRRGVYVSRARGGNVRLVVPAQDLPRLPRWSYDGRRLAYACGEALCAAAPDGTQRRLLTRRCYMEWDLGGGMAWSPDGRHVACIGRRFGDLITVRLATGARRIVRQRPDSADFLPTDIAWQRR